MGWLNLSSYTTEGQKKPLVLSNGCVCKEENDTTIASFTGSNF